MPAAKQSPEANGSEPNPPQIRAALARVLASSGFRSSKRLGQFLRFVVETKLEGREEEIKEYVIATEVYGKPADYDPQVDSSVRVEASRLRSRLREYYAGDGRADQVRILLPRGRYVPVFGGPADQPSRVREALPRPAPPPEAPPTARPAVSAGRRNRLAIASIGLLVALAAVATLIDWAPEPAPAAFAAVPLTSDPGLEYAAVLSPDGRQVAFAWSQIGGPGADIYVRQLDSEATLQLSSDPAVETSPAWSPDGAAVAFFRRIDTRRSALVLVSSIGGPERILAEVDAPVASGMAWTPDGRSIAVIERLESGAEFTSSLRLIPVESGGETELNLSLAELTKANYPAFSPDGSRLAFLGTTGPWQANVYVAALDATSVQPLANLDGQGAGLAWTHDGADLIVGRFSPVRFRSLLRVRASDGAISEIDVGDNPSQPSVSTDGSRLVFSEQSARFDIMRYPAAGTAPADTRFIASTRFDGNPQYSPSGDRIAFSSSRSGAINIWAADADGANPIQLTTIGKAGSPRWSPDGGKIAFDSAAEGSSDIYVVSAAGGPVQRITTEDSEDTVPAWSPDGQSLYFASDRGGDAQVWRTPAELGRSSEAEQITRAGGFYASADADYLYFAKERAVESSLWRLPLSGGEAQEIIPTLAGGWGNWQLTEGGVYFIGSDQTQDYETVWSLKRLDLATGEIVAIRDLTLHAHFSEPTRGGPGLSISPDGEWILSGQTSLTSDLALVRDFR